MNCESGYKDQVDQRVSSGGIKAEAYFLYPFLGKMGDRKHKMKKKKVLFSLLILMFLCLLGIGCAGMDGSSGKDCTVTISIRCDTAVENGLNTQEKWKGVIPDDGCIFPDTEIKLPEDSTVLDALCAVRDDYGIHMEYSGSRSAAYIEGIGNLYERDGGRWSGWMYSVNGVYPDVGCGDYMLEDGDFIEWSYTCDLGADLKADTAETEQWKKEHE